MVNCKGVVGSPKSLVKQEICRYCRTQVCEECYVAATGRNSMLQSELVSPVRHEHACLACSRLHPEAKKSRSPPRDRRQNRLPRLNSAPISAGPRIDSLAPEQRSEWARSSKPSVGFLSSSDQPEQQSAANVARMSRHQSPKKPSRSDPQTNPELTTDLRRRRHTSVIAPTSRSCDQMRPSRGLTARELLRANATDLRTSRRASNATDLRATRRTANATELHTSMRVPRQARTLYSCDFTGSTPRMAIRNATSTGPKELELSMMDLRDVPKARSCDLTGMDLSDEPNELRLSTVDLRLPKYKVKVPAPTKRGRRSSAADPANSALTPISIEHLIAIDAKLSSVELELKRYDAPNDKKVQPKVSQVSSSPKKTHAEPIDFRLSTVDLRTRPRRHTTTDTSTRKSKVSRHGNQEPVAQEAAVQDVSGLSRFQRKKVAEPIDFHLSTFDLMPNGLTPDAKPESNQTGIHRGKREKQKKMKKVPEEATPQYSKQEPCDLGYLENFRSFTL
uniref:Uncharacterized protein n=2 Tax=Phytophthora ramorum TaxID=164328 RepID=H3GTY9_PHYRM